MRFSSAPFVCCQLGYVSIGFTVRASRIISFPSPVSCGYHGDMHRARRHDLAPRIELLPMIDVIFLLLTFFIYAMVVMVRPQLLPVKLVAVGSGSEAKPGAVQAITLDARGQLHLNRKSITDDALDAKLRAWGKSEHPPRLFLAMERSKNASEGEAVDRGPLLIHLLQRVRHAGIEDFAVVGPPPAK